MRPNRLSAGIVSIVAAFAALAVISGTPGIGAQVATPVATPIAGGVPCTNLFGIALGNACVLILHGSPDAGSVDVYVDGELVLEGAVFGVLGDFIPVTVGEHQIQLAPSGAAIDNAIINSTVDLVEGVAYEVAALGLIEDIGLQLLPVDTRPLVQNTSRLRVVHASPDAPAIDLAFTAGDVFVENLEPGEVSAYVDFASNTYDLEARVAGTTDLALPLPGTALIPNTVYSLYVTGLVADGSLGAVLVPVLVSPDIAAATPVA
ncbi:MAG: DUF4397 domain-containing protein [Thermomicrobiales bacterium]